MNIKALPEAAELLGIKENTLRVAALKKRIPATKSKVTWLIDIEDTAVLDYVKNFTPKEHKDKDKAMPNCVVCGKTVPRKRAIYCSKECYATTF